MRIERVGLEHHGNATLCGRDVIDDHAVNFQRPARDLFQPRDHAQKRGFAAARGADKHDQLALFDVKIDIRQHLDLAIGFLDIGQFQIGHGFLPPRLAF